VTIDRKSLSRWTHFTLVAGIYSALLAVATWGGGWMIAVAGFDLSRAAQTHEIHIMIAGVLFYAVLMAIPFVPGVEISLALLATFGPRIAPAIYIATVIALALSCLIGRQVPLGLMGSMFGALGLERARALVLRLVPLTAEQRFGLLLELAPARIVPTLLRHRYITLMVALNIPGNAVVGGGGGIALLAGMSGLFTLPRFTLAVALAALPVPLFIMLAGR